jgi:hypothetical protein
VDNLPNALITDPRERIELEAMLDRLARSPRLADLLRYIGDAYFQGQVERLREHNIAIDVFGRAPNFDPAEDAIARVEAHRLRKKLTQYYALEGRDSPVQICIPPGSYIPKFVHKPFAEPEPQGVERGDWSLPAVLREAPQEKPAELRMSIVLAVAGLITLLVIAAIAWEIRSQQKPKPVGPSTVSRPAQPAYPVSPSYLGGPAVRLVAGYDGQPHIGPTGVAWGPDRYFEGGGGWIGTQGFTARANDQFLFQFVRTGDFSYNIPLSPGLYELHLYFDEPNFGPGLGGGELSRLFNVFLNGQLLLPGFDIESDAMGPNIADERIFKDVQPAGDGKLHLRFEAQSGKSILSGIEVLPGIPHKQIPIRLTAQSTAYIDHSGQVWRPDDYYSGGQTSFRRPLTSGPLDANLFALERYGHFSYAIPVDTRGEYTLVLYFAESYFGPSAPGHGGVGSRIFNVMCNGVRLLENFDIFKEAGSSRGIAKTFRHLKPSPQGKLNVVFEPVRNYANISAIEVVDESQ